MPTRHQRCFVDVSDGQAGLAVFNRGLPEYEVLRADGRNRVAVTLLRCVDMISRGDLLTRPEHAGIPCPAPEGQCIGEYTFEYAVHPHLGDWHTVYRDAYTFRAPVYLRRGDEHEGYIAEEVWPNEPPANQAADPTTLKSSDLTGDLPSELSFLTLEPETLVLSAVKRSEQGHKLIVRFYNPTSESAQATIRLCRPIRAAQAVNLNEEPQAELAVDEDGSLTLPVGGKQVRTIGLEI
ncbi:MAG: Mannosylglycerate hydrolase [Anaerolineales bacterium]|nr:Mannosylglycerate hydrolase [Anaerolineales bacterium]